MAAEVTNISPHGLWLLLDDGEHFLSFEDFPWFRDAPVSAVLDVRRPGPGHLYWPGIDVDLAVDSIRAPSEFPLVSKARAAKPHRGRSRTRTA